MKRFLVVLTLAVLAACSSKNKIECYKITQNGQEWLIRGANSSVRDERLMLQKDLRRDDYDFLVSGNFVAEIVPCGVEKP